MSNVVEVNRRIGLMKSQYYGKRKLANYVLNTGILCSHGCLYCETPAKMNPLKIFKKLKYTSVEAFNNNIAIIDPETPIFLMNEVNRLNPEDSVLISSLNDSWAPEAINYDLGRRCLEVLLRFSNCRIKILTKSPTINKDFDLINQYRDRVSLGINMAAPISKESILQVLEPNSSTLLERITLITEAKDLGISLFGFINPCMPGLIETEEDISEILETILPFNPKGIWITPISRKYSNIDDISDNLFDYDYHTISSSIAGLSNKLTYNRYIYDLKTRVHIVSTKYNCSNIINI